MLHRNILALLLLMMTGAALADTKTLYYMSATHNDYCIGSIFGTFFKSPQQAQRMCGFEKYTLVEPHKNGDYGLAYDGTEWFAIKAHTKTCELKDIPGEGINGTHRLSLPYSEKGAPNMIRRCINNCEVEDRRVKKNTEDARQSDYGGSFCYETGNYKECVGYYNRMQTGAVCIPKPESKDDTQYDDVTAHPGDGNGSNGAFLLTRVFLV